MNDVINLTEILKEKEKEKLKEESAQEWTPLDATNQASEWMKDRGADMAIIIWTEPEKYIKDEEGDGMFPDDPAPPRPVYYIISKMDRSDALAMVVHLLKQLVTNWF
tara:strand:+ start:32 stop:352 length:321 start_codon:yes stop_codon:yes gene_type:complete